MWFGRKPRNRRVGREYVLDVKLRSSQLRATRTRLAAISLGAVFATVFGTYLLWRTGQWALDRFVYENRAFGIQEIQIQTDGVIATDQLRRWAGVKLGDNLLALDLARVKRDLELVPLIQSVSVERVLPRTLRIAVVERVPIAEAGIPNPPANSTGGQVCQLDADGWVILPLSSRQRNVSAVQDADSLTRISGIDAHNLQPGRRIENPQVLAALQLVLAFDRSPMAYLVEIRSIDVAEPQVLVATTGQGSEITFGLTDLEGQLRHWQGIFEEARKRGKAIATLDLAVAGNIPARFLDAGAVPPDNPRSPRPPRNRKNHV